MRDSCFTAAVADENTAPLPIEISSVVTSLEIVTRELTKKLTHEQTMEVVNALCERLRLIPDDKRGPNRPFSG